MSSRSPEKGGCENQIKALVDSGLWHDKNSVCRHPASRCPGITVQRGLVFHDWYDWQRSRADILKQRRHKEAAGRAGGKASGASRRNRPRSRPETAIDDLIPLWHNGDGDLDVELRNFLIHTADTDLHNPAAALLGWLVRAAERTAVPGPRPVLGCAECSSGWLLTIRRPECLGRAWPASPTGTSPSAGSVGRGVSDWTAPAIA